MSQLEQFQHYQISQEKDGRPVELERGEGEFTCVCFDTRAHHFVELRMLERLDPNDTEVANGFRQRARMACQVRHPSLATVIDYGMADDLLYFITEFSDGELLGEYINRMRGLSTTTALDLAVQLTDALIAAEAYPRLVAGINLGNVMVVLNSASHLTVKVTDFGLGLEDRNHDSHERILEVGELLFAMLTAQDLDFERGQASPFQHIAPPVRVLLESIFVSRSSASPATLYELKDSLQQAYRDCAGPKAREVLAPLQRPQFFLRDKLMDHVQFGQVIGERYRVEDAPDAVDPYSHEVYDLEEGREVVLQVLPPARMLSKDNYAPLHQEMCRINADQHPNLLRTYCMWESDDYYFVAEEACNGFSLGNMIARRTSLDPGEVHYIIKQVDLALKQAADCGLTIHNLQPWNIMFHFKGNIHKQARDVLLDRRVGVWPPFVVKLRTHFCGLSLVDPPLLSKQLLAERTVEEYQSYITYSFAALARFMLTGASEAEENDHDLLIREIQNLSRNLRQLLKDYISPPVPDVHLSREDFIDRFEHTITARGQSPVVAREEVSRPRTAAMMQPDAVEPSAPARESRAFPSPVEAPANEGFELVEEPTELEVDEHAETSSAAEPTVAQSVLRDLGPASGPAAPIRQPSPMVQSSTVDEEEEPEPADFIDDDEFSAYEMYSNTTEVPLAPKKPRGGFASVLMPKWRKKNGSKLFLD